MRFSWLIICFLFPFIAAAQTGIITGKVIRADVKTPIGGANVFLSNSSAGTSTNDKGEFTLNNLRPGQYTFVVSIIGYQNYTKTVLVGSEPIKIDVELAPMVTMLHEVVISTNANWKKNYEQFVRDFIGVDDNAKYCVVINPHEVNLTYHRSKQLLEAYTNDFLVVENHALGYRVKFLVDSFASDGLSGIISYRGQRLFQELPGSKKQQEIWHKKRDEAYYGSAMHFYRSLYTNTLDAEGFIMMRLTRHLNPNRPQEEIIQQKIKRFNDGHSRDSINYWLGMQNMSKYYHENLDKTPLAINALLYRSQQPGLFLVDFSDYYLYVVYTKKLEESDFRDLYRPLDMPNYQTSVVTLYTPYLFDKNGIVVAGGPLYEGTWSKSRLSDLLPVDYVPGTEPVPAQTN